LSSATDRSASPAVRTGVWLYPDASARDLVDAVILADAAGIDEVWIADEGVAREPIPILTAAAEHTACVSLAIGITTPLLRHPGAVASTVATLDELSGGRAILGFGIGGNESLDPFGIEYDRPVGVMRDALRTARSVLAGRPSEYYSPPTHAAPPRPVPIFVGARGPQMNRLASREADGVFLSGFDLDRLDEPVAWARSARDIEIALFASARFRTDATADPTAVRGGRAEVADALHRLVARHRPCTIGLALVDGDRPQSMVERAIAVFDSMRS
jgi:5,10-methylenetetrahydromethanopterin reductase